MCIFPDSGCYYKLGAAGIFFVFYYLIGYVLKSVIGKRVQDVFHSVEAEIGNSAVCLRFSLQLIKEYAVFIKSVEGKTCVCRHTFFNG